MANPPNASHRGGRAATLLGSAMAVAAALTVGAIAMSAHADSPERAPGITAGTIGPTLVSLPPLTIGPTFTLPPFTVLPTFLTLPPLTAGPTAPATTTEAPTTAPGTAATTTTSSTTTTTTTTAAPASNAAASDGGVEPEYDLQITAALVTCEGAIQVSYETSADPDPGTPASHILMAAPLAAPAAFHVQEITGQPATGAFAFEQPAPAGQIYRVFVVALFTPGDAGGPTLIAQAHAVPATACPPATTAAG